MALRRNKNSDQERFFGRPFFAGACNSDRGRLLCQSLERQLLYMKHIRMDVILQSCHDILNAFRDNIHVLVITSGRWWVTTLAVGWPWLMSAAI
jgi:hypothetical protein